MRKKSILVCLLLLSSILLLSGCSKIDSYIEGAISNQAQIEIQQSDEYKQYEEYLSENLLNEEGTYQLDLSESSIAPSMIEDGTIPVTLARNTFLSCQYRRNEDAAYPIGTEVCYLNPGDSLYVSGMTINNSNSNLYTFSEYRIWSYDAEGRRGGTPYAEVKNDSGLLLTVPMDYTGLGFAVEPLGIYSDRSISVRAYFINNSGQQQIIGGGTWTVGKREFKDTVKISPVDSYTLKYDYSKYADDYYFVSSTPKCWYSKDDSQTVIFQEASTNEELSDYSVLMHPYVTLTVKNNCISLVDSVADKIPFLSTDGKGIITSITKADKSLLPTSTNVDSFDIPKLRVGDVISVRVGKDYKITGTGVDVGTATPLGSNADNGYEYTIIVPDTNKGIQITVTKRNGDAEGKYTGYSIANADLTLYRKDGSIVQVGDELPAESEKVTVEIKAHSGYYLDGKSVTDYTVYSKSMKFSAFQKDINSIITDHPAIQYVTLTVNPKDDCGTCVYKLDGNAITSNTFRARIGQKIELEFTANSNYSIVRDGWISDKLSSLWGKNSASAKIEVTADMNGSTITRTNFGIKVEKVG